jgi:nucleotidyltransferase/DNA polymerase involved in DNA repair
MKKRKTKLVLSKLPMRYFTRAELNKKTKRSLITLYLELQRVVVKLVKLKVKGVGKRLTKRKRKRSAKQIRATKKLIAFNKRRRR